MHEFIFEPLIKGVHARSAFDCGIEELNFFLKHVANQQQKRGLNVVYVAVLKNTNLPKRVFAYCTLSSSMLYFKSLPHEIAKKPPHNYPIPTIKIGRLAKDKNATPKGFGTMLLGSTLNNILNISKNIGVVAVDVDAKNEKAKHFHLKFGFIELQDDPMGLIIPISTVRKALEKQKEKQAIPEIA